ncbi:MAG: homocysteine S-methyltransferase family protein [Sakamotonia sp.]|jgi:5-methyltetrahydrofolate--homocysteine methyltransferase
MDIREELKQKRIFFDGGMGSMLQERGLLPGELPELWNLSHPETVKEIHLEYLRAGADVVTANTFGANRFKYKKEEGYSLESIVTAGVSLARAAVQEAGHGYAALDLGPTGRLLAPYGDLEFEDACLAYKEVVEAGVRAGADLIIIETMGDCYELKAAVLAAKEASSLPVSATVTLDEKGKMLTGGTVEAAAALLEGLGADVIGLNCGLGPVQLLPFMRQLRRISSLPLMANPNAGLPRSENGRTVYDIDAAGFAGAMKEMAESGVSVLGGCCGTTPDHIRRLREACGPVPLAPVEKKDRTVVSSYGRTVVLGERPVIIGERINPTGKPKLKQALKERDMAYILNMAASQEENGADILDVNVGLPGLDETAVMTETVRELQSVTDLPLQIDTLDIKAMEQAMRIYNGKPMVNSVNGKKAVMDAVFPLVRRYGGVVVALCLDENGIPETADGRLAVAKKIYETAASYGIDKKDILVDALCMAVSSDKNGAMTTLETVRRVREELGGKTVLGVSNISFGLPMREHINSAFFLLALENGLSAAIINPGLPAMAAAYKSFLVLHGMDENCSGYVEKYGLEEAARKSEKAAGKQTGTGIRQTEIRSREETGDPDAGVPAESPLKRSIKKGMIQAAEEAARNALLSSDALTIINREMIPALDEVGKGFEAGTVFLPQLLMSAEAARAAFGVLKEQMARSGVEREERGTVILATVKGDIHDIGKNIVKVLLENYGFQVMDLGRDVPPEAVVSAAVREKAPVVGLSALMTTTVPAMEETIRLLRERAPWVKIMVGGAVLTKEYADSIGADGYCKDAMASVNFAVKYVKKI